MEFLTDLKLQKMKIEKILKIDTTVDDKIVMIFSNNIDIVYCGEPAVSIDKFEQLRMEILAWHKSEVKKLHLPVVNAWVAVDTPPKVDYFYLAYDQDLCMITKALFDGEWHANEDDFNVTHWMELPKPPLR